MQADEYGGFEAVHVLRRNRAHQGSAAGAEAFGFCPGIDDEITPGLEMGQGGAGGAGGEDMGDNLLGGDLRYIQDALGGGVI
ncbi:hypothetical protein [Zoogloea sp.]|uniref:hypothetical protein n=1 Tax=Zoogloea sp. TaxID=49181 RepID=UPI0037DA304D